MNAVSVIHFGTGYFRLTYKSNIILPSFHMATFSPRSMSVLLCLVDVVGDVGTCTYT